MIGRIRNRRVHRMRGLLFVWLLAACSSPFALGQAQVKGRVLDAATGEGLASATIQIEGTYQGTITNESGRFVIWLSQIPARLVVRHIGYRTAVREIKEMVNADIAIELQPAPVELDEVVVSGEDPAIRIMREVIRKKQQWRQSYQTTYSEVYTRFWLFSEFDPVQVNESVRAAYWLKGTGTQEVVRARRIRPRASGTFRFAGPEYAPNFYDDIVTLRGTRHVTPTHPEALDLYRFRLGGKRKIDDADVWDIYFTPRSASRAAFSGHVAVIDSVFAILELDAHPEPPSAVTPPVEFYDVRYQQHFVELDRRIWVPVDLQARGQVRVGRLGASYPTARFEQTTGISNYAIDAPLPDSLFQDDRSVLIHPAVDESDFLFIRNPTIIPLTPRETESLSGLDPTMTINRAFRPEGMLRAYTAVAMTEEAEMRASSPVGVMGYIMHNTWVWYNRVDGWQPGIKFNVQHRSGLSAQTRLGYAAERKQIAFELDTRIPFKLGPRSSSLGFWIKDSTEPVAGSLVYGRFVPGLMGYLGYDDYYDYFRRQAAGIRVEIDSPEAGLGLHIGAKAEKHSSEIKHDDFNGWWFRNVQRENPPIDDGEVVSLDAALRYGSEENHVLISAERSMDEVFGSDFGYTSVEGQIRVTIPTLFRNRERPNLLRIEARATTFSGDLPVQRRVRLDGTTGFLSRTGTFRAFQEHGVAGEKLISLFWEHDFTSALAEGTGLWTLATQGWGVVVFGGHGEVWTMNGRSPEFHEMGIGISYPFRLPLRVDFAAGLNFKEFTVTIGSVRF